MKLLAGRKTHGFLWASIQSHYKNNERDTDSRYIISPSGQRYYATKLLQMNVC
jgi:hypothetical protein